MSIIKQGFGTSNYLRMYRSYPSYGALYVILLLLLLASTNAAIRKPKSNAKFNLARQFLQPHNAARAAVRMPPLKWDSKLASYAKWWASQRQYDCELRHSNGVYGENIFWGSGKEWRPAQAVAAWVAERRWYNYWRNSCANGQMCGHYTQIVWRNTKRVGCAVVTCYNNRGTFIICSYDPPGNYIGERPY